MCGLYTLIATATLRAIVGSFDFAKRSLGLCLLAVCTGVACVFILNLPPLILRLNTYINWTTTAAFAGLTAALFTQTWMLQRLTAEPYGKCLAVMASVQVVTVVPLTIIGLATGILP